MTQTRLPLPQPRGHAPLRLANALRRTTSLDITWPAGRYELLHIKAVGRDLFTRQEQEPPQILHKEELFVTVDENKNIQQLHSLPNHPCLQQLLGVHSMKALRAQLNTVLATQRQQGLPIYQLVSDISGSLVAADWAWSCRKESLSAAARAHRIASLQQMAGVCTGFSPNASALFTDGGYQASKAAKVVALAHPDDPIGWHSVTRYNNEISFRRARRIDLWVAADERITVESTFQDSAIGDDGQRLSVHEYSLKARFNPDNLQVETIAAIPHILPFPECPGAVAKLQRLVGTEAYQLREAVSQHLRKVDGCTHLNDAARALAEVPALLKQLQILCQ